ncbi:dTDP-4-dehydrorhamnose reductase [Isoptericola sp. b490]|uniref:dTDP-4-dehydrorhamnose reductase n=1 Tax=Actinotalea lenta TaxID=3064654 RepID=UPI002712C588|nr:dTDP-4-dehydrorhamnose reductase [Isoptericola sp. b490]MDO8119971.1 dTDP-4-dehydrorhamnose reductase [Isoptericola sp. b490]
MRWLVVGAQGMLGQDLVDVLREAGHEVAGVDRPEIDITDPDQCVAHVADHDVVVNCAAWTAVDAAEDHEPEAFAVNGVGAAHLARAAHAAGARIVQISTDYVFDGDASDPYPADAPVGPRSAYGRTKVAGEWAVAAHAPDHLIVRTAWLYGARGACFPATIARVVREKGGADVVADQIGQPTWTVDLARLILRLVEAEVPAGTYHGTSAGRTSWYDFARAVVAAAGLDPETVRPTTSEAFVRPAHRPAWSVLSHDGLAAIGVEEIGDWQERWAEAALQVLGTST